MPIDPRSRLRPYAIKQWLRGSIDRRLRGAVARLARSSPVLVPEYPLVLRPRWGWGEPVLSSVDERLAAGSDTYGEMIAGACALAQWAARIPRTTDVPEQPYWENDWWGTVDALVQCAALRARDPALYLEIGSGVSTMFARRAIADFGLRTRLVSVDPQPRVAVDQICDEVIRRPFQEVSTELLERLAPGDVVLVDGSHMVLMNTDATVGLLEMLPALPSGVLVGIDDVFLPADYPPSWALRGYAEQYVLAAFLLGGADGFTVRFPGWWVVEHSPLADRFEALWPIVENRFGRHATSFWMERD